LDNARPFGRGPDVIEDDSVGALSSAVTLGKVFNFFSIELLPQWAFTAFAEFQVFGKFTCVWIKRVAIQKINT
jgi:hypothetical protein